MSLKKRHFEGWSDWKIYISTQKQLDRYRMEQKLESEEVELVVDEVPAAEKELNLIPFVSFFVNDKWIPLSELHIFFEGYDHNNSSDEISTLLFRFLLQSIQQNNKDMKHTHTQTKQQKHPTDDEKEQLVLQVYANRHLPQKIVIDFYLCSGLNPSAVAYIVNECCHNCRLNLEQFSKSVNMIAKSASNENDNDDNGIGIGNDSAFIDQLKLMVPESFRAFLVAEQKNSNIAAMMAMDDEEEKHDFNMEGIHPDGNGNGSGSGSGSGATTTTKKNWYYLSAFITVVFYVFFWIFCIQSFVLIVEGNRHHIALNKKDNTYIFGILAFVLYVLYIVESYTLSTVFRYISNVVPIELLLKNMAIVRGTQPQLQWHIVCSHTESRGSGKHKRTVTVVTHRNSHTYAYQGCTDLSSKEINRALTKIPVTKLHFSAEVAFANETTKHDYESKRNQWIAYEKSHHYDRSQHTTTTLHFPTYFESENVLCENSSGAVSSMMSLVMYMVCTCVSFSWCFRKWFDTQCEKRKHTFVKAINVRDNSSRATMTGRVHSRREHERLARERQRRDRF